MDDGSENLGPPLPATLYFNAAPRTTSNPVHNVVTAGFSSSSTAENLGWPDCFHGWITLPVVSLVWWLWFETIQVNRAYQLPVRPKTSRCLLLLQGTMTTPARLTNRSCLPPQIYICSVGLVIIKERGVSIRLWRDPSKGTPSHAHSENFTPIFKTTTGGVDAVVGSVACRNRKCVTVGNFTGNVVEQVRLMGKKRKHETILGGQESLWCKLRLDWCGWM